MFVASETHRNVLNQILRQCTIPLLDRPFAVLVKHPWVLDFDVKLRYFRRELEQTDEDHLRQNLVICVNRRDVFEDSYRQLHVYTPDYWKRRFRVVFDVKCTL